MPRVGLGYDVHPFGGAGPLILGGVEIAEAESGLAGHSDGDAVAHAVADALLGAAGLGDLGSAFPADDPALAGADSMRLLEQVVSMVLEAGWVLGNVDVVVAAERPKLAASVGEMAANLGRVLRGVPVSVKPKYGEGVGAIGRGEGIAVWAIALIAPAEGR